MRIEGVAGRFLDLGSTWFIAAPAAVGIALGLGFLAPIIAVLTTAFEVATWAATQSPIGAVHVCAVLDAIALGMGPRAYSLDSRLFGRRKVILRAPFNDSKYG
jgi:hypothetical protein